MPSFLPIFTAALAILAVAIATAHLAVTLRRLQTRLAALEAPPQVPPPASGRSPRPFGSALYSEPRPSPLAGIASLPGAAWLVVAGFLLIVAIASGMGTPAAAAHPTSGAVDSTVVLLRKQVDSLATSVALLRDSVRAVGGPARARSAEPATRNARSSGATASASAILPAPVLPPATSPSSAPVRATSP